MTTLKRTFLLFTVLVISYNLKAQTLYSERFNTLSLTTATYNANSITQTYLYGGVPVGMTAINSNSVIADTLSGNYPFRANGQKTKAWLGYKAPNQTDTFAVSTSWLKPIGTADALLITPTINNIAANTVLTWEALAPDANNMDGYEIFVSTNTVTAPNASDFINTNKVFTLAAENNSWTLRGVSLAAYAGQNIRIAFKNNSTDKYQLWLDDIIVKNITNGFDVVGLSNDTYKYGVINTNNVITSTFKNNGFTPLTSMTINYKVGPNSAVSQLVNFSPALNYLEERQLTFGLPFNSVTTSYNVLKTWANGLNGQNDQATLNDTTYGSLTISASSPAKKTLVEEHTGAWCGWCPDGYTKLSAIVATNTNVIATALHDNDNMSIPTANVLSNDYISSFPSATIDQYYFAANGKMGVDRLNWSNYINLRQVMKTPASVSITAVTYNSISRQIDATVQSSFVGDVKGDYRLNFYVKENNVYGPSNDLTDNNWNQHSYLYNVGASPYYQVGSLLNPGSIPSTYLLNTNEFKHNYVINYIADGAYGAAGIIPSNAPTIGQTYSKAYTYTLPLPSGSEFRYNANNTYLIGVLTEYNTNTKQRAVLNTFELKLTSDPETTVGIKNNVTENISINLYPNPTSDVCYLNYYTNEPQLVTASIYNTLGELVSIQSMQTNTGNITQLLNTSELNQGNYSVVLNFKNNSITKKLIIIK